MDFWVDINDNDDKANDDKANDDKANYDKANDDKANDDKCRAGDKSGITIQVFFLFI